jgi:hypothetical protein
VVLSGDHDRALPLFEVNGPRASTLLLSQVAKGLVRRLIITLPRARSSLNAHPWPWILRSVPTETGSIQSAFCEAAPRVRSTGKQRGNGISGYISGGIFRICRPLGSPAVPRGRFLFRLALRLCTAANDFTRGIHDRMPDLPGRQDHELWLTKRASGDRDNAGDPWKLKIHGHIREVYAWGTWIRTRINGVRVRYVRPQGTRTCADDGVIRQGRTNNCQRH